MLRSEYDGGRFSRLYRSNASPSSSARTSVLIPREPGCPMQFKRTRAFRFIAAAIFILFVGAGHYGWAQDLFNGGIASSHRPGARYSLEGQAIEATWSIRQNRLANLSITDRAHQRSIAVPSFFSLRFADGSIVRSEDMHFTVPPELHDLQAKPRVSRYSDGIEGKAFEGVLESDSGDVRVAISLTLRNGSNYLRQFITISAPHRDLAISDVRLIDVRLPNAQVVGTVAGSPIVDQNFFLGFEHPLSSTRMVGDRVVSDLERTLPLPQGQSITYSSVIGVAPTGQMRRAFLTYLERERAHPYRTFLHYNSWYDAGYFTPYDQATAVDRINAFGRELHEKRGVTLDSFLFDDW